MTRTDEMIRLAAFRPSDETIDHQWEPARRTALVRRIVAAPDRPAGHDALASRRRRILLPGAAVIGAAAVAAVVLGLVLPGGVPGSAPVAQVRTLEQLAVNAENSHAYVVGRGQYLYFVNHSPGGTTEEWTGSDGTVWQKGTRADGVVSYLKFGPGGARLNNPSPKFLTTLPRDPAKLEKYMRAHVSGSASRDEAVFVAAGDMLRSGLVPPDLRAALIRVLERTPHVSAMSASDVAGRPVLAVSFEDQQARPGQVDNLWFDPSSAAFLGETSGPADPAEPFSPPYTWKIVNVVPAEVLAKAQLQED